MRILSSLPLLFVLAVLVLCLGIWEATGLTGKDEFYLGLRTPLEMLHDDHWLVPFLDGVPRIKKPPLLYWLGRASYELFGASLVSARMLVVLFGGLLVVATAAIGRRLSGERTTGTVAALILLGMLGLATESRRFMLDIPVAALSASAFWLLLIWSERPRWPWLSGASLLLAAAFLIKGPIAVIVCGSGLLALLIGRADSRRQLLAHWPSLCAHALLFAALALPWFYLVKQLHPAAAEAAFAGEIESRQFFQPNLNALFGLFSIGLPWVFVFAVHLGQRWRNDDDLRRLLLTWFLAATLPFLLIRAFDRYLVGSLVPLAIFLACLLPQLRSRLAFRLGMLVALLPGLALGGFAAWFGLGGWPWLLVPALYLAWAWWNDRGLGHLLAAPIIYWTTLLALLFPALGINALPAEVVALGRQQAVVFFEGPQPAMLAILSGQPHRQYRDLAAHAAELAQAGTPVFAESDDVALLQEKLAGAGYRAVPLGSYRTLASHGSGLRFARNGAGAAEWQAAFVSRSLAPLQTQIEWFRVEAR